MTITNDTLIPVADDAKHMRALLIAVLRATGPLQLRHDDLLAAQRDLTSGSVQLGRSFIVEGTTWAGAIENADQL